MDEGLAIIGGRRGMDISPVDDGVGDSLDMMDDIEARVNERCLDNQNYSQETMAIISSKRR